MSKYILAIDQGTTSCRAIIYDEIFEIVSISQKDLTQYYPQEGWVEHNPVEIWQTQLECCREAMSQISISDIKSIGITNQRETIIAWNRTTGEPIYPAIVWQDRRTMKQCEEDIQNLGVEFQQMKTGLNIDAYFSAPKIRWILQNVEEAKILTDKKELCFGTVDSWILWNLTMGEIFATDYSNASRTNLFNIRTGEWDIDLLNYYQIDEQSLPLVVPSIGPIGKTHKSIFGIEIPISGIAGDQQAALYGHDCLNVGDIKNTFGTGCFLLQNIGASFKLSSHRLLTTIAWREGKTTTYALEGSVFNAGSALKWLKENLNLFKDYFEIDSIATSVHNTENLFFVPAFTGLGAPYWDMNARGLLIGLNRNTNKAHFVRAAIEALAFQTRDIIEAMLEDSKEKIHSLQIDGGVSESDFLHQSLADILQIPIFKTPAKECTALGVAKMAAKGIHIAFDKKIIRPNNVKLPIRNILESDAMYEKWKQAVERSKDWSRNSIFP